jgi:O-acetyl-ADP-ribose deacetylase (regulator of RNase III)
MITTINGRTIELVKGDITKETTIAIANATSSPHVAGGGVDAAIHAAAGPEVLAEREKKYPGGIRIGSAVITGGGKLAAKWILHTVGPKYSGGAGDAALLLGAYDACLKLCGKHGIKSVAFPSISTGSAGYPAAEAASVAVGTVARHLEKFPIPSSVRFVLFDDATFEAYHDAIHHLGLEHGHAGAHPPAAVAHQGGDIHLKGGHTPVTDRTPQRQNRSAPRTGG